MTPHAKFQHRFRPAAHAQAENQHRPADREEGDGMAETPPGTPQYEPAAGGFPRAQGGDSGEVIGFQRMLHAE